MNPMPNPLHLALLMLAGLLWAPASAEAQPDHYVYCPSGPYVLCDQATCTPIARQKGEQGSPSVRPDTAICICQVEDGPNLGPGPCENRVGPQKGQLLSTYSAANHSDEKKYLTCDEPGSSHTTCYGYPCLDNGDGTASCTCPIYYDQTFVTLSATCDPSECAGPLRQAATPTDAIALNSLALHFKILKEPKKYCSGGNEP